MSDAERSGSNRETHNLTGIRNFWKYIRPSRNPAGAEMVIPASPEDVYYDVHRNRVAAQVLTFFNAVDARVGEWIGYSGNIREELKGRVTEQRSSHHGLNLQGLDPSLQQYVQHNIFFFRLDNKENGPRAMYKIDCQAGGFTPSVYMETHDGSVEATLFLGPNRDKFEHVKLRKVYNDGRVRQVSTFVSNYENPYSPPHPLTIEQGEGPMPYTHVIYDKIDAAGNVALLDGQTIYASSGNATGKYSSANHTVSPIRGGPFPYSRTESELRIGGPGDRQIPVPLQTNIYDELSDITASMRAINP